jgi:3-hydroxyacyl-CoA dehydrogenase
VMYQAFPDRVVASPLVPAMVKQGRLGQKSGRGFFSYQNKKGRAEEDPALDKLIAPYRRGERKLSREELTNRLFLPMLLEATRMLEDRIVRDVRDVDLGLIFGLGARFQPTPLLKEMATTGKKFYPRSTKAQ